MIQAVIKRKETCDASQISSSSSELDTLIVWMSLSQHPLSSCKWTSFHVQEHHNDLMSSSRPLKNKKMYNHAAGSRNADPSVCQDDVDDGGTLCYYKWTNVNAISRPYDVTAEQVALLAPVRATQRTVAWQEALPPCCFTEHQRRCVSWKLTFPTSANSFLAQVLLWQSIMCRFQVC